MVERKWGVPGKELIDRVVVYIKEKSTNNTARIKVLSFLLIELISDRLLPPSQ